MSWVTVVVDDAWATALAYDRDHFPHRKVEAADCLGGAAHHSGGALQIDVTPEQIRAARRGGPRRPLGQWKLQEHAGRLARAAHLVGHRGAGLGEGQLQDGVGRVLHDLVDAGGGHHLLDVGSRRDGATVIAFAPFGSAQVRGADSGRCRAWAAAPGPTGPGHPRPAGGAGQRLREGWSLPCHGWRRGRTRRAPRWLITPAVSTASATAARRSRADTASDRTGGRRYLFVASPSVRPGGVSGTLHGATRRT